MSESIVIANSTIRQQDGLYCLNDLHRARGGKAKSQPSYWRAEIGDSGMTRDMKLYELRMLVFGYMQNEDPKKAAEVFEKWIQEVKEAGDE